jgi:hypothetical protein
MSGAASASGTPPAAPVVGGSDQGFFVSVFVAGVSRGTVKIKNIPNEWDVSDLRDAIYEKLKDDLKGVGPTAFDLYHITDEDFGLVEDDDDNPFRDLTRENIVKEEKKKSGKVKRLHRGSLAGLPSGAPTFIPVFYFLYVNGK